jgi:hypothetical protein
MATEVNATDRKRGVRRMALWLALVAAAFYFGFIALGVFAGH